MNEYRSHYWSMRIREDWSEQSDETFATFLSPGVEGALQVSAARNSKGSATDDDLRDFAQEHFDANAPIAQVEVGEFKGYYLHYRFEDVYQRQWWLRSVNTVVMITYTCSHTDRGVDDQATDEMVASLQRV